MEHTVKISEEQRQMILLALSKLRIERPGWDYALGECASRFPDGRTMFADFVSICEEVQADSPQETATANAQS